MAQRPTGSAGETWKRTSTPKAARARASELDQVFKLVVQDREIIEYVPRADRAAEVIALIEQAVPEQIITAVETEHGWRAKGRPRTSNGGKGGVSTVDWKYRARIA
jgi:hypothetical protein